MLLLNNGTVTGDNGATTWEAAIDDMNNALQEAGYNYQYEMGANKSACDKVNELTFSIRRIRRAQYGILPASIRRIEKTHN